MFKKFIFILISFVLFLFALYKMQPVETELAGAFLSSDSTLVKLTNISSNYLDVLLESKTEEGIENLKSLLPQNKLKLSEITNIYKNYPTNFLSENSRTLLQRKNYKTVEQEALERAYNPLGIYIAPLNKDPYLFATDFVMSQTGETEDIKYNGKYYYAQHYKINNNSEVKKFISAQKQTKDGKIYLTGVPIHTYITSQKSAFEINIICIISTLALFLFTKYYFKSSKIIIPIALSILFGFMIGFSACALIFKKLHILTFVFSTSLIGISLDYSLHYFLTCEEKGFKKNLTASMFTTIIAFSTLLFSNMELLKQIAIFTSFGLLGVYFFVLIMLPKLKISRGRFPKFNIAKPYVLGLILIVIIAGSFRLSFNDNIKNLYKPDKKLLRAETLYHNVFNKRAPEFILIKGKNVDEILEKEEKMNLNNTISLANFISSKSKQKENQSLVKNLYKSNLNSYSKTLGLTNIEESSKLYDVENFPLNKQFMLDKTTSYIITPEHRKDSINPATEISNHVKQLRKECLKLIPIIYATLFLLLTLFFGYKNSIKIIISPLLGILFTIGFISLFIGEINLFNILAIFLITGFSLDYSIFRLNSSEKSKDAVFMSAASTALSFLLLSFTSFKVISSLGMTLFIGITASYILSLFMLKSRNEE